MTPQKASRRLAATDSGNFPQFLSLVLSIAGIPLTLAASALRIHEMSPVHGPPGTAVTVKGEGWNIADLQVQVHGIPALITEAATHRLVFVVDEPKASGEVEIRSGGQTARALVPFSVTRRVSGQLVPPDGLSPASFVIGGFATIGAPVNAAGDFVLDVPVDEPVVVWGFRGAADPAFLGLAVPGRPTLRLDPVSTAAALVLIHPGVSRNDPGWMTEAWPRIEALGAVKQLGSVIATVAAQGTDYLDDARFVEAWVAAVAAFQQQQAARAALARQTVTFKPGAPFGTALGDLNPVDGPFPVNRLSSRLLDRDAFYPNDYRLELAKGPEGNRLDWYVELFELDPKQFHAGLESIQRLSAFETPRRRGLDPVDTGVVTASLDSKKLHLLDRMASAIVDLAFSSGTVTRALNQFPLARQTPAVYVSQAYSGNPWYGTRFFMPPNLSQADLLDRLGASEQSSEAMWANLWISAIDMVGAFVPADALVKKPDQLQKSAYSLGRSLLKTGLPFENMDADTLYALVKKLASAILQEIYKYSSDEKQNPLSFDQYWIKKLNVLAKAFDLLGKVSSALQSLERFSAIAGPYALALERSVVVIGNPFAPVIASFTPTEGRGGQMLTVSGYNFPEFTRDVTVAFVSFASTEDPTRPTARLEATVLASRRTSLAVRVPTNFLSTFPNGRAFIAVETTNRNVFGTSMANPPPYREFIFRPPPDILGVTPDPVTVGGSLLGGVLVIQGTNFFAGAGEAHTVVIDGTQRLSASTASDGELSVTLPRFLSPGAHELRVEMNGQSSRTLFFRVVEPTPAPGMPGSGVGITVTKLDFSNAPDGEISLLEAFLIASGKLGRPIEQHPECEFLDPSEPGACAPRRRETDFVVGDDERGGGGGAPWSDSIALATSLRGSVLTLTQPLPAPSDLDVFDLPLTFAGGALPPGSVGWDLAGVRGATLRNAVFRDFPGHGIVASLGASDNVLENVRVERPGATGVLLETDARGHRFQGLRVDGAGSHGIHLSGAAVTRNHFERTLAADNSNASGSTGNQGNGIRIEGGASFNLIQPGIVASNRLAGIVLAGNGTRHNLIGREEGSVPILYEVRRNGGPGVHLSDGARHNVLRYLSIAGNQGDGVLLEGANCAFNQVDGVHCGLDTLNALSASIALPNEGSGIHVRAGAHHNLIGSWIPGSFGGRGVIAGNRDDGVLIEDLGTDSNIVSRKHIGQTLNTHYIPNGKCGIRIRNGAKHNTLGAAHSFLDLHIMASLEAGIMIEGDGTEDNLVLGNQIGTDHQNVAPSPEGRNRVGIHLRHGAARNVIGQPGEFLSVFDPLFGEAPFRFANAICRSVESAIVLENCASNVIQNNKIGEEDFGGAAPNQNGVRFLAGASRNLIGGPDEAFGNRILYNHDCGLHFEGVGGPAIDAANSSEHNLISGSGLTSSLVIGGPPEPLPPSQRGIGILIDGGSASQQIGGSGLGPNHIHGNKVGIWIEQSHNNRVLGQIIASNLNAGLILSAALSNAIGSDVAAEGNIIIANGSAPDGQGGIVLDNSRYNRIQGNRIGARNAGNHGPGIVLRASGANTIGGATASSGNIIVHNRSHGIHVLGANSTDNSIQHNWIGRDRDRTRAPNDQDGIRLEQAASYNTIGGTAIVMHAGVTLEVTAPNVIAENTQAGVRVRGADTVGNEITYNVITANFGLGIENENGGNHETPPPRNARYDGGKLSGDFDVSGPVTSGSVIHIYSDTDPVAPEGAQWLGTGTVGPDGAWSAPILLPPAGATLSMTVTRLADGSTSEFGTGIIITHREVSFLQVERPAVPPNATAPAGASDVILLPLTVRAHNGEISVRRVQVDLLGAQMTTPWLGPVRLVRDLNGDGRAGPGDPILGESVQLEAGASLVDLTLSNATLRANTAQQWLITAGIQNHATSGASFSVRLASATMAEARFAFPAGAAAPVVGVFPIISSEFTVGNTPSSGFNRWQRDHFSSSQLLDPLLSGTTGDPDGDDINNLLEYAFNLDPRQPDRRWFVAGTSAGVPAPGRMTAPDPDGTSQQYFTVTYVRRTEPVDLEYTVEWSRDLTRWLSAIEAPAPPGLEISRVPHADGFLLETVTVRTADPITGPEAAPIQFMRVRVRQR